MQPGHPALPQELPVNLHRTLTFQEADRVRNAVLRGNAQAEMHVVRHRLPFEQLDAPLVAQRPQNPSDLLAQLPYRIFLRNFGMMTT